MAVAVAVTPTQAYSAYSADAHEPRQHKRRAADPTYACSRRSYPQLARDSRRCKGRTAVAICAAAAWWPAFASRVFALGAASAGGQRYRRTPLHIRRDSAAPPPRIPPRPVEEVARSGDCHTPRRLFFRLLACLSRRLPPDWLHADGLCRRCCTSRAALQPAILKTTGPGKRCRRAVPRMLRRCKAATWPRSCEPRCFEMASSSQGCGNLATIQTVGCTLWTPGAVLALFRSAAPARRSRAPKGAGEGGIGEAVRTADGTRLLNHRR